MLAFVFAAWIATAWFIYLITVEQLVPQSVEEFITLAFTTPEGWAMIIAGNGIGFGFAVVALAISVVSFPMLVDRRVGWDVAMRTSVQFAQENPFTIGTWGLIIVGLLALGSIPLFAGLGIVLPVLDMQPGTCTPGRLNDDRLGSQYFAIAAAELPVTAAGDAANRSGRWRWPWTGTVCVSITYVSAAAMDDHHR